MSRFIESIRLEDGRFENLFYHENRMRRTLRSIYQNHDVFDLDGFLKVKPFPQQGVFKCRIVYDQNSREVSFSPYSPGSIRRLKLVHDDNISYAFKSEDRRAIDRLFDLRGDCDDVLIIRQGEVTDCSFANIAFRKGQEWFTPGSALLEGTMRQRLIDENRISIREIHQDDIRSFETFRLVNAMLQFNGPEIEVSQIVF
jgi:4-amino-4-deoxychorismate lyase